MLQLDLPKSIERVLLSAVGHVERIPKAEGSLSSDLAAQIAGEGGGRGASDGLVGRRSERGTACDDGGEYEGGLHLCFALVWAFVLALLQNAAGFALFSPLEVAWSKFLTIFQFNLKVRPFIDVRKKARLFPVYVRSTYVAAKMRPARTHSELL